MSSLSKQVAPIHRLDASSWTRIGYYLGANGATQLYCTGSIHLATVVRSHIRDLNLEWTSLRFIDMHQVMAHMTRFKRLTSFIFRQAGCTRRSWTPVQWTLLPSTLTSLSLCFLGAPSEFLVASNNLLNACPHLEHLALEDELPFAQSDQETWRGGPVEDIYLFLSGLPSTLLSLHIVSQRQMRLLSDISELPSSLQDLKFNFPTNHTNNRSDFSQLPLGLKRLFLRDQQLYMVALSLPASLEYIELHNDQIGHVYGLGVKWKDSEGFQVDMTGAAKHLVNLTHFLAPNLRMTARQALDLLPPSVTLLDVQLISKTWNRFETFMDEVGWTLVSYHKGTWKEMESAIFDEEWSDAFESLESLTAKGGVSLKHLPTTLKSLSLTMSDDGGDLPLHLQEFKTILAPSQSIVWSPSHNLRSIMLQAWRRGTPPLGWVAALPDTLERLVAPFREIDDWRSLMNLMTLTSRLPNLSHIVAYGSVSSSLMDCLTPRQLKRVSFRLNTIEPPSDALRSSLPQSHVEELWIDSDEYGHDPVFSLLSHLPQKLKSLFFKSGCDPSPVWPVTLPKTLTSLGLGRTSSHGQSVYNPYRGIAGIYDEPIEQLVFPPLLTQLHLATSEVFPAYDLPALSLYDGVKGICLQTGSPPSPGQVVTDYIFKENGYHLPSWLDFNIDDTRSQEEHLEDEDSS